MVYIVVQFQAVRISSDFFEYLLRRNFIVFGKCLCWILSVLYAHIMGSRLKLDHSKFSGEKISGVERPWRKIFIFLLIFNGLRGTKKERNFLIQQSNIRNYTRTWKSSENLLELVWQRSHNVFFLDYITFPIFFYWSSPPYLHWFAPDSAANANSLAECGREETLLVLQYLPSAVCVPGSWPDYRRLPATVFKMVVFIDVSV